MAKKINSKENTLASSNIDLLVNLSVDERGRVTYLGNPVGSYGTHEDGSVDYTNFVLWSTIDKDGDGVVDKANTANSLNGVNYTSQEISNAVQSSHDHSNSQLLQGFSISDNILYYMNQQILTGLSEIDILKKRDYTDSNGVIQYSKESGAIVGLDTASNKTYYGKNSDGVIGFHPVNAELNVAIEQYIVKCKKDITRVIDLPYALNNNNVIVQCYEKVEQSATSRLIYELTDMYSDIYSCDKRRFDINTAGEIKKKHYYGSTYTNKGYYETDNISLDEYLEFVELSTDNKTIEGGMRKIVPLIYSNEQDGYVASASTCYDTTIYQPWKAFSRVTTDSSHVWYNSSGMLSVSPQWLQIKLPKKERAIAFTYSTRPGDQAVAPLEFYIEGTNDNEPWDVLYTETNGKPGGGKTYNIELTTTGEYQYYRFRIVRSHSGDNASLAEFNLYTYSNHKDLVPKLTSHNSTPGITVSASSEYSDTYQAWKAFTESNIDGSDCWYTGSGFTSASEHWIKVDFSSKQSIIGCTYSLRNSGSVEPPLEYRIEGSNNEVNWTVMYEGSESNYTQAQRYDIKFDKMYEFKHVRMLVTKNETGYVSLGMLNFIGNNGQYLIKTDTGYYVPTKDFYDVDTDSFQPVFEADDNNVNFDQCIASPNIITNKFDVNGIEVNPLDYFRSFKFVSNKPTDIIHINGLKAYTQTISLKNGKNLLSSSEIYSITPVVEICPGCDIRGLISINKGSWSKYDNATNSFIPSSEDTILDDGMTIDEICKINFIGHDISNLNLKFAFKVNSCEDVCKLKHVILRQKSQKMFKKISEQDYDVDIYTDELRFTPHIDKEEYIINVMM